MTQFYTINALLRDLSSYCPTLTNSFSQENVQLTSPKPSFLNAFKEFVHSILKLTLRFIVEKIHLTYSNEDLFLKMSHYMTWFCQRAGQKREKHFFLSQVICLLKLVDLKKYSALSCQYGLCHILLGRTA